MSDQQKQKQSSDNNDDKDHKTPLTTKKQQEIGGPKGLEPTRYGDWEKAGRCIDF